MNILRFFLQRVCHHKWQVSWEECAFMDDGAGEHTGMRQKWTCRSCGKVLYSKPDDELD